MENENNYIFNEQTYKLVLNYKDGFLEEEVAKKYSEILEKYDFIVGDLSYGQLRLRGFYYDDCKGAPRDMKISTLEDYILEYCSFGCPYFVLERISGNKADCSDYFKRKPYISEKKKKIQVNPNWVLKNKKGNENV